MLHLTVINKDTKKRSTIVVRTWNQLRSVLEIGNWSNVLFKKENLTEFYCAECLVFEFGAENRQMVEEVFKDYRYVIWSGSYIILFFDKLVKSREDYDLLSAHYQTLAGLQKIRNAIWWPRATVAGTEPAVMSVQNNFQNKKPFISTTLPSNNSSNKKG